MVMPRLQERGPVVGHDARQVRQLPVIVAGRPSQRDRHQPELRRPFAGPDMDVRRFVRFATVAEEPVRTDPQHSWHQKSPVSRAPPSHHSTTTVPFSVRHPAMRSRTVIMAASSSTDDDTSILTVTSVHLNGTTSDTGSTWYYAARRSPTSRSRSPV